MVSRVVPNVLPVHTSVVTHVDTQQRVAALTFDDGPHPVYTPRILMVFDKHRTRGTFFMVGAAAEKYPHLVRSVAERGHDIGNHTWDHPSLPALPRRLRRSQILACQRALFGYDRGLLRPPYGHYNMAVDLDALALGYTPIAWSLHVNDWRYPTVSEMVSHLLSGLRPGSIVLLHDAIFKTPRDRNPQYDRSDAVTAIDLFLTEVGRSFEFVTIPELMNYGQPVRQEWCITG